MFAIVHRCTPHDQPQLTGERMLAAILFENTMDRDLRGSLLGLSWNVKRVVPRKGRGSCR